ncbi:unnamed protein product [Brassica rapa subsp. trilocularis]
MGNVFGEGSIPNFNLRENSRLDGDICINGVLYFKRWFKGSFVIVSFDVRSEKVIFIYKDENMLPKPYLSSSSPSTLFNYKDKVGLHRRVEQNLVLWVLEDAGNHKWSKHSYVLSPFGYHIVSRSLFVGMTSTGEIVYSWNSSVWFYNIEKNTVKGVNIQGLEELEHLHLSTPL